MEEIQTYHHFKILFPRQQFVSAFRVTSITENQEYVHTIYISTDQSIEALSKFNLNVCQGISVLSLKNESNGTYKANIVNSVHEIFIPVTYLIGRILFNLCNIKDDVVATIETTKFVLDLINEYVLTPYQNGIEILDVDGEPSSTSSIENNDTDNQLISFNIKEDSLKPKVYLEAYRYVTI